MDKAHAVALLAACRPVCARIAASGKGVTYAPLEIDWPALQGYMEVSNAFRGEELALLFDELRRAAGLRPSDLGLLRGVLDHHAARFPGVAEAWTARLVRRFSAE